MAKRTCDCVLEFQTDYIVSSMSAGQHILGDSSTDEWLTQGVVTRSVKVDFQYLVQQWRSNKYSCE